MTREEQAQREREFDEIEAQTFAQVWPERRVLSWRDEIEAEKALDDQFERMRRRG